MQAKSPAFRAWLPAGSVDPAAADRRLETALADWSAAWLAAGRWGPDGPLGIRRPASGGSGDWHVRAGGLAARRCTGLAETLAAAMLGAGGSDRFEKQADLQLAESLAAACMGDLLDRLAALFGLPGAWEHRLEPPLEARRDWLGCGLGPGDGAGRIEILVRPDLLVPLAKSGLPAPGRDIVLGSLAEALDRQRVEVTGLVGRCALSLAELDGLAPGDVLVIDRPLALPLDLSIDGRPTGRRCAAMPVDGGLALELLEPLAG